MERGFCVKGTSITCKDANPLYGTLRKDSSVHRLSITSAADAGNYKYISPVHAFQGYMITIKVCLYRSFFPYNSCLICDNFSPQLPQLKSTTLRRMDKFRISSLNVMLALMIGPWKMMQLCKVSCRLVICHFPFEANFLILLRAGVSILLSKNIISLISCFNQIVARWW